MQPLNLPSYEYRRREGKNGKPEIFDPIRRKFVRLTPEEWVRQHLLHYLVHHKGYPASLIVVEAKLSYNNLVKRGDIVVYGPNGKPLLVVECKAPQVPVTQAVFDQAAMYNMSLQVGILVVTNGLDHFSCRIDHRERSCLFLAEIPRYEDI
jgi:hypothetical protein